MQLRDLRTSLSLEIAGYEFPDIDVGHDPLDPDAWTSNWLIIEGEVSTQSEPSWSFQDACLTTWEVAELADWLYTVATGVVSPLTAEARGLGAHSSDESIPDEWLRFTEPDLSFAVSSQSGERVQLLICLSHELAQPPLDLQRPTSSQITIETTPQHVHDAAAALHEHLAAFPAR